MEGKKRAEGGGKLRPQFGPRRPKSIVTYPLGSWHPVFGTIGSRSLTGVLSSTVPAIIFDAKNVLCIRVLHYAGSGVQGRSAEGEERRNGEGCQE